MFGHLIIHKEIKILMIMLLVNLGLPIFTQRFDDVGKDFCLTLFQYNVMSERTNFDKKPVCSESKNINLKIHKTKS